MGGAATVVLLGYLYTVAAPTSYFRARIPFLLASGGANPFLFTLGLLMAGSLIGLLVTRGFQWRPVFGAALVAFVGTVAVASGAAARVIPQFPESNGRWVFFVVFALVGVAMLARERMKATHGQTEDLIR